MRGLGRGVTVRSGRPAETMSEVVAAFGRPSRTRLRVLASCSLLLLFAIFGIAAGEAVTLKAGDLVVGDSRTPVEISVVNSQTGVKTRVCQCTTLVGIRDVAVKGTDKIYAAGSIAGAAAVVEINPATGAERVVSSGGLFQNLQGIAVEANGSILVTDSPLTPGTVIRVNPSTGQQTVVSTAGRMLQAWGLTVGPSGQIFVAANIQFPAGVLPSGQTLADGVLRIDPVNGQQTVVAFGDQFELPPSEWTEMLGATDVTMDQAGSLYVLDKRFRGNNLEDETRIIKVNPTTGAQTRLTNSFKGVDRTRTGFDFRGIAIVDGVVYAPDYRLSATGRPGISQFDPSVGSREGLTDDGFVHPSGLDAVRGNPCTGGPRLSVTPASRDFGTVTVGTFADRPFTVRNTACGTLTGTVSVAAAPFSVASGGSFTLGGGASQNVVVRFRPGAGTTFAANVAVQSNAGSVSRALTGAGELPVVSIVATAGATEAGNRGTFRVSRTGSTAFTLTVKYTVGGSATSGTDFSRLSGSVTIPVSAASAIITVTPINDTLMEGNENVVITLTSNVAYRLGAQRTAALNVVSDEKVTVTASTPTAREAPLTSAGFRVTRTGSTAGPLTVLYTIGGSATEGSDYRALPRRVTIPAGTTSAVIVVNPINDAVVEGNETVVLTLSANNAYGLGTPRTATVTIISNE